MKGFVGNSSFSPRNTLTPNKGKLHCGSTVSDTRVLRLFYLPLIVHFPEDFRV